MVDLDKVLADAAADPQGVGVSPAALREAIDNLKRQKTHVFPVQNRKTRYLYRGNQIVTTFPGLRKDDGTHAFEKNPSDFAELKTLLVMFQNGFFTDMRCDFAATHAALLFLRTAVLFTAEMRAYLVHKANQVPDGAANKSSAFERECALVTFGYYNSIVDRSAHAGMLVPGTPAEAALRYFKNQGLQRAVIDGRMPNFSFPDPSAFTRERLLYEWNKCEGLAVRNHVPISDQDIRTVPVA